MTKTQEAFFAMALKVKNFGAKNAATIATNTPLTALFAQLGDLIMQLIAADGGARLNISGITIDKANKRKLLENLTLKFFNAIESYSVLANETGLRKKVRFPASKWYSCSEEELVMQASIAKNLATPLLPILVDYGVAAAHFTAFESAISTFTDVLDNPYLAIIERAKHIKKREEIIVEIRTFLNQSIDVLMLFFKTENESFYNLYLSARAIKSNGNTKKPKAKAELLPHTTTMLHSVLGYNPNTLYTLENKGKVDVKFSLSDTKNEPSANAILLKPGEKRSRMAENLSASGRFLVVENKNEALGVVWLWVEG